MLNMNNKQKSEQEKLANKILYITVAAMLIIMATIVLLGSMLSRAKKPIDTDESSISDTESTTTTKEPQSTNNQSTPSDSLPVIADTDDDTEASSPTTPDNNTIPTLALPADGFLSKEFSDKVLVYSSTMEDYRTHTGIDINASLGANVVAAADGRVSNVWYDPMMGQCIKIEHNGNLTTIYRNLSQTVAEGISIGSTVSEGDVIGYIGESAMVEIAQEPHLHFEVQLNGKGVDPIEYMSSNAKNKLLEDNSYEG